MHDTLITTLDDRSGTTVRPAADDRPVPEGWTVSETRWNGHDIELAVDPSRLDVIRVGHLAVTDATAPLEASGWRHVATDSTGASLWVREASDRPGPLDRLATAGVGPAGTTRPSVPGPSVA
jgi:hypothetical protein